MARQKFLFRMLPYSVGLALAVLVAWGTSFLGLFLEHGLPFAWKFGGCPGPHVLMACVLDITYDWGAFGLDVLFYATIGWGIILAYANYKAWRLHRSLGRKKSVEDKSQTATGGTANPFLRLSNLVFLGVLVTFLTGNFFGYLTIFLGRTFFFEWGYGFPFAWITGGCPPFAEIPCFQIGYSFLNFLLDTSFYTVAGYALLSAFVWNRTEKAAGLLAQDLSDRGLTA